MLIETAKAKVNLSLKVDGKLDNGYHQLNSLVAFTDFGDQISFEESSEYTLSVLGPFSSDLRGENLINKLVAFMSNHYDDLQFGHISLVKNLPVASGIGGGSADAAAVLRYLSQQLDNGLKALNITKISEDLGADIPVCLTQQASFMRGIGERVEVLEEFPKVVCILVNPNVPVSTSEIFEKLDAPKLSKKHSDKLQDDVRGFSSIDHLLTYLEANLNDLQVVAEEICPAIKKVLNDIRCQPGCYISRMSGSGATCFGLFSDLSKAQLAVQNIKLSEPNWWINYGYLS